MRKLLLASIIVLAMLPVSAAARGRRGGFHHGGFHHTVIVPHYGFGYGYGWYDPFWGPYPYQPFLYANPNQGKVKLETKAKDAEVYINGSYAGTVGELKSLSLHSGNYTIELRDPSGRSFEQKIYVVAGKTIHLRPSPDLRDGS